MKPSFHEKLALVKSVLCRAQELSNFSGQTLGVPFKDILRIAEMPESEQIEVCAHIARNMKILPGSEMCFVEKETVSLLWEYRKSLGLRPAKPMLIEGLLESPIYVVIEKKKPPQQLGQ